MHDGRKALNLIVVIFISDYFQADVEMSVVWFDFRYRILQIGFPFKREIPVFVSFRSAEPVLIGSMAAQLES